MLKKVVVVLLVVFMFIFTAIAMAGEKIDICHKGDTISISENAWPAHEAHGDYIGPCESEDNPGESEPCDNDECDNDLDLLYVPIFFGGDIDKPCYPTPIGCFPYLSE